jgi:3'(2'), 5'-bisphosphate nucleotidase
MIDRAKDLAIAVDAVRAASRACVAVQREMVTPDTLQKRDKSPVSVADFASQAIVCRKIIMASPDARIVGEEDSAELREPAQRALAEAVARRVSDVLGTAPVRRVMDWIDLGGSPAEGDRYWTLDPIDGTKGFLRGDQYAVALALIEDGQVVLGVLGCPNFLSASTGGARGALFTAVRGEESQVLPLDGDTSDGTLVRVTDLASASEARFCESVESGHSNQSESARIARELGIVLEPYRIDSQAKYAAIARGDAQIYLRMPTRADYREKIWDHAAGKLVVECAGGTVTDIEGRALDFSRGKTLEGTRGVVATCGTIHHDVIEAVRRVRALTIQ